MKELKETPGPNFDQLIFLVTRFNVRYDDWKSRGYIVGADDPAWMRNRWSLFEEYCLPSIVSQSRVPDEWMILFDSETSDEYKEMIAAACSKYPWIKAHFIPSATNLGRQIGDHVFAVQKGQQCITIRLDSDDILHELAIQDVTDAAATNGDGAYFLTNGLCYRLPPRPVMTRYDYPKSPFLAFAETVTERSDLKTVFSVQHDEDFVTPVRYSISSAPRWIQIIHTENLSNSMRGRVVFGGTVLSGFKVHRIVAPKILDTLKFFATKQLYSIAAKATRLQRVLLSQARR